MRSRSLEPEILDDPRTPERELLASLDFMGFVNRRLGGTAAVTGFLERAGAPRTFTLLDAACGGGDIAAGVARWARKTGREARILGLDLNPACIAYARRRHAAPGVSYAAGSVFDAESLGRFDYVVSSMFFHHLDDGQIGRLLRIFARCASRGLLVNDLYRSVPAWIGAWALALPTGKPIVWNDAPLSVKRGFREGELERLAAGAGLEGAVARRRPVFRVTLEWRP